MYKISNPESFRYNIRQKLAHYFEDMNDETVAQNLEKGIYNYAIKESNSKKIVKKWENPHFAQLYTDRLRTIYLNLKNEELLAQIKSREILPQTIAFMTHQEFKPDHWRSLIEKKIKRDASKYTNNIEASTDMFTCKKCRSKKCTYYELQTRSADEPATLYISCLDCGTHWKK